MSDQKLNNLNSACCRVRGAIMTVEGLQKESFPDMLNAHVVVEGRTLRIQELSAQLEPLLKALLVPMLAELKELRNQSHDRSEAAEE